MNVQAASPAAAAVGPAKDTVIEIAPVGNGFIVRPSMDWFRSGSEARVWAGGHKEYLVFRTLAELQVFLAQHFSHRAQVRANDQEGKAK